MAFDFNPALSAAQNIDGFYKHLESIDAELALLLKANMSPLLPLPDGPSQRKTLRQNFNGAILKHLDKPKAGPTK